MLKKSPNITISLMLPTYFFFWQVVWRSSRCSFFSGPGSNSVNIPIVHLFSSAVSCTESWQPSSLLSPTIWSFRWNSSSVPSWGGCIRLSWKKRSVQHLGTIQIYIYILIQSLFQDWCTPDYVLGTSVPVCHYSFSPITYFLLPTSPITHIIVGAYCLIAPSVTSLLTSISLSDCLNNETS